MMQDFATKDKVEEAEGRYEALRFFIAEASGMLGASGHGATNGTDHFSRKIPSAFLLRLCDKCSRYVFTPEITR